MDDPRFDTKDWSTLGPLVEAFRADLLTWDSRYPSWHEKFKMAYRVVLNQPTYDRIWRCLDRTMDFSLPEPVYEFLVYLWAVLYPGEPWKDTVDLQSVRIDWKF